MSYPPITAAELARANKYLEAVSPRPVEPSPLGTLDDFIMSLSPADMFQLVRFIELLSGAKSAADAAGLSPIAMHVVAAIKHELTSNELDAAAWDS